MLPWKWHNHSLHPVVVYVAHSLPTRHHNIRRFQQTPTRWRTLCLTAHVGSSATWSMACLSPRWSKTLASIQHSMPPPNVPSVPWALPFNKQFYTRLIRMAKQKELGGSGVDNITPQNPSYCFETAMEPLARILQHYDRHIEPHTYSSSRLKVFIQSYWIPTNEMLADGLTKLYLLNGTGGFVKQLGLVTLEAVDINIQEQVEWVASQYHSKLGSAGNSTLPS
jgi:hypothetical protein